MKKDQGFIQTIVIIVIAIIIISFLGIDIKQVIDSPTTQHNFSYITQGLLWVWDHLIMPLIHILQSWKK